MTLRIKMVEEARCRKAVISEDGLCIEFVYKGHEWTADTLARCSRPDRARRTRTFSRLVCGRKDD